MKCVTCLVTLVLTRSPVSVMGTGMECHLFRFMRGVDCDFGEKIDPWNCGFFERRCPFVNWFWHKLQLTQHPQRLPWYDFPQIASFDLLDKAYHIAKELGMTTHVGNVLSSMSFKTLKEHRAW